MANKNKEWKEVGTGGKVETLDIGKSIEGELKAIREGEFGKIYDLEIDGELKTFFGKTVLDARMEGVSVGTFVKIERLEDYKTKTGRMAQNFKVFTA